MKHILSTSLRQQEVATMKVVVILSVLLISGIGWAETYRWVDEKGTVNFTQDYHSIPEKYRDQVEERQDEPAGRLKADEKPGKALKRDPGKGAQGRSARDPAGEKTQVNRNKIESDAAETLRMIVSLWKDEKYEALYEYGTDKNRASMSREKFVQRMKRKVWGLASSWETLRDIDAEFKSPTLVYVTARIGHKPKLGATVKIQTETYPMKLERGLWKIDLSKILNAP
ncbi:MAG: DUF4124 domain-containing protein [Deltaproteobacteria bacterium]|nr:MAG: DUF4124 domain-containing protein [Deltaproteobacteria bacterium]